ncbi:MAG TPA: adenylyl-sulfate kinase [Acidimicrobiales bacterium]|nr:adenylyl-sulfate kinase [Acidimicrobiales bacterium]
MLSSPGTLLIPSGLTVWFTGLPSAGKSTLAGSLQARLLASGHRVEVLDGDEMRWHLGKELGFDHDGRSENVRRIGFVASLLARNGVVALCPVIAPYSATREEVRVLHRGDFFEVYVSTSLFVCRQRDVKGLYARSDIGEVRNLTGVDDPYEVPERPDVVVSTEEQSVEACTDLIVDALASYGTMRQARATESR